MTGKAIESTKQYYNGKIKEIANVFYKKIFKYDSNNNLIRIEYCHNLLLKYCYTSKNYEYNANNELVSCKVLSEDPNSKPELIANYEYKNDKFGNWIYKEISNPNDKTLTKINRIIKYYNS